ncbi:MAG: glycosyltransferase family 9 protein [candidate division WOR-3 bacterium]
MDRLTKLINVRSWPDILKNYETLLSHPDVIRTYGGWIYRGRFYPDYLTVGGAGYAIFRIAKKYCKGKGIDVGAGKWPLPGAIAVDLELGPGSANSVEEFENESLDYVFSSHCLEHIEDWIETLSLWIKKLKVGGVLFLYLPHPQCEIWHPNSPFVGDGHKWIPTVEIISNALLELGCSIIDKDDGPDSMMSFFVCALKQHAIRKTTDKDISPINESSHKLSHKNNPSKTLLWVRTDSIGDNLLSLFMLPYLKRVYNISNLIVLCRTDSEELYQTCPYVNQIITFDSHLNNINDKYLHNLLSRINNIKIDIAINPVHSSTELSHILTLNSGARCKIGFIGDFLCIEPMKKKFYMSYYDYLVPSESHLEIKKNCDFLKYIGIDDVKPFFDIWLTQEDIKWADTFFAENNLDPEKTVALFAGAQHPHRYYFNYGKAIGEVCNEEGLKIVALGSKKDYKVNEINLKDVQVPYVNLCGKTTFRQAVAVISKCRIALGSETSLAHVACFVGTPNVILLGGGSFGRFMPYSPLTTIVCLPVDCLYCNWICKYKVIPCVTKISPELLKKAFTTTLKGQSNRARVFIQNNHDDKFNSNQTDTAFYMKFLDENLCEIVP